MDVDSNMIKASAVFTEDLILKQFHQQLQNAEDLEKI